MKKGVLLSAVILIVSLLLTACSANQPIDNTENNSTSVTVPAESEVPNETEKSPQKTGVIAEQILNGNDGEIHYSYYLPENYDGSKNYPLVMTMPGYGMMWFGEDSSGSNLEWNGFRAWTELPEDVIVVSAQLTDWHETSARQAIELTEYYTDKQIGELLILEIPNNEYFNSRDIYNYHGGGNIVFDDETVLNWILSKSKT